MNTKVSNAVDSVLIVMGATIGFQDIESILGIILLCVDLVWIVVKGVLLVYSKLKKKDIDGAINDVNSTINSINGISTKLDSKEDKNDK